MESLKMTTDLFRLVLEACPMPVLIEANGGLTFANQSALSLLDAKNGYSLEGIPVSELIVPDGPQQEQAPVSVSKARAQSFSGVRKPVSVTSVRLEPGESSLVVYYLNVLGDENETFASAGVPKPVAEVMMNLRRAGHDLNQPLTIISGKSQLLMLDADESNPIYKSLKSITDASFRMGEIVQNISRMIKSLGPIE